MQRYKQLPIIRYGSKKSMIKKDKKRVSGFFRLVTPYVRNKVLPACT